MGGISCVLCRGRGSNSIKIMPAKKEKGIDPKANFIRIFKLFCCLVPLGTRGGLWVLKVSKELD